MLRIKPITVRVTCMLQIELKNKEFLFEYTKKISIFYVSRSVAKLLNQCKSASQYTNRSPNYFLSTIDFDDQNTDKKTEKNSLLNRYSCFLVLNYFLGLFPEKLLSKTLCFPEGPGTGDWLLPRWLRLRRCRPCF